MSDLNKRLDNEREHAKFLLKNGAGMVWGWSSPAGQVRVQRRVDHFIHLGGLKEGVRVLEIGCGTGIFSRHLAESKADIVAIDLSEDLIENARLNSGYPNLKFEVMDAMNTTFEDASFDVVLGCSVLHHLDPKLALDEFYRLLKPKGRLVFSEPNMLNPQIAIQKNIPYIKRLAGDSPDETAFFSWQARGLMKNAGFKDCQVTPFDFLHPSTPKSFIGAISKFGKMLEATPLIKNIAGSLIISATK